MERIDKFLDNITMYRLMLYYLIGLVVIAALYSFLGILGFNFVYLIFSAIFLLTICLLANEIFAKVYNVPANAESVYITALILVLIITPTSWQANLGFLFWAGVLAMASKFILNLKNKHLFNPAGISVLLTAFVLGKNASWWVGTEVMMPFVLAGGVLIVRKLRRWDLVISFFMTSLLTILGFTVLRNGSSVTALNKTLLGSGWLFFGFVMLTEPQTMPPTRNLRLLYGGIIGFLFSPQIHLGQIFTTPEIALSLVNFFSYLVSPKEKLLLTLKEKNQLNRTTYDFVFTSNKKLDFIPGQYMEWTLENQNGDSRGNRRYFTLASSPTETEIRLGIKFNSKSSSFKKTMLSLTDSQQIIASGLAGDFTLLKNKNQKLVFVAGGIGITPFRSMIKYLIDKKEKRDIVLFYSNKTSEEIVYQDIFERAEKELEIKTIYIVTEKLGRINAEMIKSEVSDWSERLFYLSGPHSLVTGFKKTLVEMGISKNQIKTDYFPGFV